MLIFAGQEDPFPGNEAVVEDHVGIRRTRHKAAFVMLPRPQVVDGHDLLQAVPVTRNGKSHGVVLVFGAQGAGGKNQNFIGHGGLGNVHLAAFDHDAVLQSAP